MYEVPNAISTKTWNLRAATPEGRKFTEGLAGNRLASRESSVRNYVIGVHIAVDREKAFATVDIDDFGTGPLNAVAATTIIGDVQRALLANHRAYEVTIADSPSQAGLRAALEAHLKDARAEAYPTQLHGEPATCFVVRLNRPT